MTAFHPIQAAVAALGALLLSACATAPGSKTSASTPQFIEIAPGVSVSQDPHAPLERRVTDRWKLLIAKDAARAFEYLTPGYRATTSVAAYDEWLRSRQIKWTEGKYVDRHCSNPTTCTVSVQVSIETTLPRIPGIQVSTGIIEEKWLQIDGVWYHLPKNAR